MVAYVTLSKFANESGYTEKALRNKIQRGDWQYGVQWLYAPDNRILVSIEAYNQWVEKGLEQGLELQARARFKSASCTKAGSVANDCRLSPPPLI